MACFEEIQLPPKFQPGVKGGPQFATVVITAASGGEQRVAEWESPRREYEIDYISNPADAVELVDFFCARQGRLCGFRMKDWADYSTDQPTPGATSPTALLTSTTFQLQRSATSGTVTTTRNITKPVSDTPGDTVATNANSTVRVFNASMEVTSGWTLDTTTGILTFDDAPDYAPTWTGEYDIPVRFDSDRLPIQQDSPARRTVGPIGLIEERL